MTRHIARGEKTYVERKGKLIEVATVDVGIGAKAAAKAAKVKRGRRFVGFPWAYLVDIRRRLPRQNTSLAVAALIYRRTVICSSRTVTLPNADLAELGVSRSQKSRALALLAGIGLIRIERNDPGRTSRVTLLRRG